MVLIIWIVSVRVPVVAVLVVIGIVGGYSRFFCHMPWIWDRGMAALREGHARSVVVFPRAAAVGIRDLVLKHKTESVILASGYVYMGEYRINV